MAKIIIDGRFYGLEYAGLGRYTINLLNELQKLNSPHKFSVLLRKKAYQELNFTNGWSKILADYPHYSVSEQLKLPGLLNSEKPDMVHFLHLNVPLGYKGAFMVTLHDLIMHKLNKEATTLPLPLYIVKRIPYKLVTKNAVNKSKIIITPSESVKNEIVNMYKINVQKVAVIYEGITNENSSILSGLGEAQVLAQYRLSPNQYLFYVGNAYPHKNIKSAIKAVLEYNDKRTEKIVFAIAGSRDVFKARLEKLIKVYDAQSYIKLLGYVPDDALTILYKNSLAFIYPSLSEGFGLQGLEAIAAGSILMASDIPVFKEIYDNNAIYFDPLDQDSIILAINKVISMDVKEKVDFVNAGKIFINKYSWKKMAEETLKLYERCISLRQSK